MTASRRTDALLALVAGAVFLVSLRIASGALSIPWLAAGGAGTLAFEAVATRRTRAVRRYWDRASVQAGAMALALVVAVAGATLAPSVVLSAAIGAIATYLLLLGLLVVRDAVVAGE